MQRFPFPFFILLSVNILCGLQLYSGFWVHQVSRRLVGAESILSLMGYAPRSTPPNSTRPDSSCLMLEGVLDPDLISRLALDCLIAYCECQVGILMRNVLLPNSD